MKKRITKRAVDALAPKTSHEGRSRPNFLWDTGVTGFGCKVTPTGRKVYVLQYRPLDQRSRRTAPKRLTLGKHGDLTPDQARTLAAQKLLLIKAGTDPIAPTDDRVTVVTLLQRFLTEHLPTKKRPPRPRTLADYDRIIRMELTRLCGAPHSWGNSTLIFSQVLDKLALSYLGTALRPATPTISTATLHVDLRLTASAFGAWIQADGSPSISIEGAAFGAIDRSTCLSAADGWRQRRPNHLPDPGRGGARRHGQVAKALVS